MLLEDRVLYFISSVRKRLGANYTHYLNGGCYSFYLKLVGKFPNALAYYDSEHIITKIGDKYYDITGEVQKKKHLLVDKYYKHDIIKNEFNI